MASKILFFTVSLTIFAFGQGGKFDDCKYGQSFPNNILLKINLGELTNNFPRDDEILRTKIFLNTKAPVIYLLDSSHEITFGKHNVENKNF